MSNTTIFTNAYYQKKPQAQYSFTVDFIFEGKEDLSKILSCTLQNFKIPDMKINTITLNQFGFTYTRPARAAKHGGLSLSFNDNSSLNIRGALVSLYQSSFYSGFETSEFFVNAPYRIPENNFEIIVNVYKLGYATLDATDENNIVGKIHFTGCFVENISGIDFDYSSQDIVKWTTSIKYDNMYFEAQ